MRNRIYVYVYICREEEGYEGNREIEGGIEDDIAG
jgi:hypothetical protein